MTADPRFWDNVAERYAAKPVDLPEAFDRKTDITKSHLTPDTVVLDVGCGTGTFALRLAPHAAHVHGLDLSPAMLEFANDKAKDVENVTFHQGTLDTVHFEPESFDGICAYSLLHLVEDLPGTLNQIYGLLKPGGFFISSTACLAADRVPYRLIIPVMRLFGKAPFVRVLKHADVTKAIEEAGFHQMTTPDVGAAKTTLFMVAFKPDA